MPDEVLRTLQPERVVPRASLLVEASEIAGLRASIWMGGAHSYVGDEIHVDGLAGAWIIDCAGEMPAAIRERSTKFTPMVFPDLDGIPTRLYRIEETAREAALIARSGDGGVERIYSVCQHGMNRSGLLAGLMLRELGMPGDEVVRRIRERRPGALANHGFVGILLG